VGARAPVPYGVGYTEPLSEL